MWKDKVLKSFLCCSSCREGWMLRRRSSWRKRRRGSSVMNTGTWTCQNSMLRSTYQNIRHFNPIKTNLRGIGMIWMLLISGTWLWRRRALRRVKSCSSAACPSEDLTQKWRLITSSGLTNKSLPSELSAPPVWMSSKHCHKFNPKLFMFFHRNWWFWWTLKRKKKRKRRTWAACRQMLQMKKWLWGKTTFLQMFDVKRFEFWWWLHPENLLLQMFQIFFLLDL